LGVIVFVLLCGCLPFDDDSSALSLESVETKFQLRFPSWAGESSLPPFLPPSFVLPLPSVQLSPLPCVLRFPSSLAPL
jgi:hypothetical protein